MQVRELAERDGEIERPLYQGALTPAQCQRVPTAPPSRPPGHQHSAILH